MSGNIASVGIVGVRREDTGEFFVLTEPSEAEYTMSQDHEAVFALGPDRYARGLKEGAFNVSGSLTIPRRIAPEIDWSDWMIDGIQFSLISQAGEGGKRVAFIGCKVSEFGHSQNAEGELSDAISWVGTRPEKLS